MRRLLARVSSLPLVSGAEVHLTGCDAKAWAAVTAAHPGLVLRPAFSLPSLPFFYVDGLPTAVAERCAIFEKVWQLPVVSSAYYESDSSDP
jgi:hypothetical protein